MRDIDNKPVLITGAIVLLAIGSGIGYLGSTMTAISPGEAGETVKNAFEAQGQQVTIESVTTESPSLYKVVIASQNDLSRIYITKDGQHIIQSPINSSSYIQQAGARSSFLDCLSREQTRIIGDTSRNATITQLQILGGTSGLEDIYVELTNETRTTLLQQGVTTVPVTVYNGTFHEGVHRISFFENLTGCEYRSSAQMGR